MEKDFKLLETAADVFGGIPQLAEALGKKSQSLYAYKKPEMRIGRKLADDLHKLGFNRDYFLGDSHRLFAEDETGKALQERVVREIQEKGAADEEKNSIYLWLPSSTDHVKEANEEKARRQVAQRWALVREWLTETGTMAEWYFILQQEIEGLPLEYVLSLEGITPEREEWWVFDEPTYSFIARRGINLNWVLDITQTLQFAKNEAGRALIERLKARYSVQDSEKATQPVERRAQRLVPA